MSTQTQVQLSVSFRGERLRALRKQQGISADRLAHATGLTARHIFRLERNERPQVRGITAAQLALALETSIDYLFGLTNNPAPPTPPQPISKHSRE